MKVYVDELPESCCNCPCLNSDCDYGCSCNLNTFLEEEHFDIDKKHPSCTLQSLTDYTNQVRKEVVEDIREKVLKHFEVKSVEEYDKLSLLDALFTADVVFEILDQIQGETKC